MLRLRFSAEQRSQAAAIPQAMREAIAAIGNGQAVESAIAALSAKLLEAGFDSIDYAEVRDADSLVPLHTDNGNTRLFVAARIGGTRLIDNMAVA